MNSKLKIITSMLIFGSIGIFVKNINLSSMEIAFLRAVIGSLFLAVAGFVMKQRPELKAIKQNAVLLILSGAAIGFNWIMLFQAYKYTTISTATLSYYFAPVFLIIMSPIILKEKLSPIKIVCIIMAMLGLFLILDINGTGANESYNNIIGILYGLSGAALYASVILMNKFIKNLSGFETTLIQLMVSGLVLVPSIIFQDKFHIAAVSSKAWMFILIVGIIHTGIAYLLYFTSIKQLNGQSIAILSYIDPISAVIIAAVVLGETMTLLKIAGGIFILGSTFLSERLK
jgi:RarD protein